MLILGIFSFLADPKHALSVGFHSILLWLDSIVYEFVAKIYEIFVLLAKTNIFSQDFYQNFAQRVYAVLGVVMLFVLAYSLLKALVDPEQLTKGDKGSINKMVPTFVVSLVIIGLLPSIFDLAYNVQNYILEENTIGVLVLGSEAAANTRDTRNMFGKRLAYTALHTFLNQENACDNDFNGISCDQMEEYIVTNSSNFFVIINMADAIADGEVIYRWGFSTGVGLFLIYVIANFCLDLAVRAARLAFLQLMAPIPILMRVLPTKNDVFKNWLKKTVACFTEVFVRVFIMYMAVYFISNFKLNWNDTDGLTTAIANILIIMGILMFVKEFPKLLSDITGIDSGNIKLGIKDFMGKLGAGGFLAAGGVLGAGLTAGVRNLTHAGQNFAQAKGFKGKVGALGRGVFSTASGVVSGGVRGGIAGAGAKNFSDMRNAAIKGAHGATDSRDRREAYRAAHKGNVFASHVDDMFTSAKEWAQGGFEAEEAKIKYYNDLISAKDKAKSAAEALMNKTPNNAKIVAHDTVNYKGISDAAHKNKFIDMFDGKSLGTIRQQIDKMVKDGVARENFMRIDAYGRKVFDQEAYDRASIEHSSLMDDMNSMYKQLEKATIQKLQTAAYNPDLMRQMGYVKDDGTLDVDKFSGITAEIDNLNNMLERSGDPRIDLGNAGAALDKRISDIETSRNKMSADLERKKRAREARQQNSGKKN